MEMNRMKGYRYDGDLIRIWTDDNGIAHLNRADMFRCIGIKNPCSVKIASSKVVEGKQKHTVVSIPDALEYLDKKSTKDKAKDLSTRLRSAKFVRMDSKDGSAKENKEILERNRLTKSKAKGSEKKKGNRKSKIDPSESDSDSDFEIEVDRPDSEEDEKEEEEREEDEKEEEEREEDEKRDEMDDSDDATRQVRTIPDASKSDGISQPSGAKDGAKKAGSAPSSKIPSPPEDARKRKRDEKEGHADGKGIATNGETKNKDEDRKDKKKKDNEAEASPPKKGGSGKGKKRKDAKRRKVDPDRGDGSRAIIVLEDGNKAGTSSMGYEDYLEIRIRNLENDIRIKNETIETFNMVAKALVTRKGK